MYLKVKLKVTLLKEFRRTSNKPEGFWSCVEFLHSREVLQENSLPCVHHRLDEFLYCGSVWDGSSHKCLWSFYCGWADRCLKMYKYRIKFMDRRKWKKKTSFKIISLFGQSDFSFCSPPIQMTCIDFWNLYQPVNYCKGLSRAF